MVNVRVSGMAVEMLRSKTTSLNRKLRGRVQISKCKQPCLVKLD